MGDVLHALPAVAALRNVHPNCHIGWAIEPRWLPLLASPNSRPIVDAIHLVDVQLWKRSPLSLATARSINALRHELRNSGYDLCVDLQGTIRSAVVGRLAGAPEFAGPAAPRETPARFLYRQRLSAASPHVVDQACELLGAAIGETLAPAPVTLPTDPEDDLWASGAVGGKPFILIAPTAGWGAKTWPADRFGAVAATLAAAGWPVLVNASSAGDHAAAQVARASGGRAQILTCSLGQLIALTRRAALVIAGDTGPLHLAAALNRPVVALFGPTDPARNGPFGTRAIVLRDPSSLTSHARLAETDPGLVRITVEQVVAAALSLLAEAPDRT